LMSRPMVFRMSFSARKNTYAHLRMVANRFHSPG
jgi:hypothetical protein